MITLQRFYTLTDALNLKYVLEAEGIAAMIGGESLGGIVGVPYSVNLLDEADLGRARQVVVKASRSQEVQRSAPRPP